MRISHSLTTFFLAMGALSAVLLIPGRADAGIVECGGIYLSPDTTCEFIPPGASCTTQCTPISLEASCAGQLQIDCQAMCTGSASVECTGSCDTTCKAQCEINPGSFDCSTYCTADCTGGCQAQCAADATGTHCRATCEANCSASCDTECNVVPASADCTASCMGSCEGSCTAESNLECQSSCTSDSYLSCETKLTGECNTDCDSTAGALFCDGQYVASDNVLACVKALKDNLDITVNGAVDVECSNDGCTATGVADAGCATGGRGAQLMFGFLLLGLFLSRRRS